MLRRLLHLAMVAIAGTVLLACSSGVGNGGRRVGGPCTVSAECAPPDSRCQTGIRWPEGMCVLDCSFGDECPGSSVCVQDPEEGGLCLLTCDEARNCRDGYACTELPLADAAATEMVCANPL
ncbi:MAG: hypothetical protein ACFCGT_08070 [Sandaracinaceae bacterium]